MMSVEPIGLFWDVDGTIADSYKLGFDSTNSVLLRHNRDVISESSYHEGTKFTTPRRLAWHVTGNPDDPIGESLGKEFDDLYVELVSMQTAKLYDGMGELIRNFAALPNVRFAALSNACTSYVEAVLRVNNLDSIFVIGWGPDKVPQAKPAPDGLLLISETLNIPPLRCIYIGDSPTDGQAARAAGMSSIGVTWGSHAAEKVRPAFDDTVDSPAELATLLQSFVQAMDEVDDMAVAAET